MDPRKQRTIDALLAAAEQLLVETSIEELTVEDIASRAGVAVGSIYNHFGSKAGLHAVVVERARRSDEAFMDRAYESGGTPVDRIRAAASEYLDFYLEEPEYFRMLAFPGRPGNYAAGHELGKRLATTIADQNRRLVDTIREGITAGELREVDPDETATVLWAAWNGIISLAWRPDRLRVGEGQLRRLLTTATDMVAHGLLAPSASTAER